MGKNKGNIQSRLATLRKRHAVLDDQLADLGRNPCPVASKRIKRQKLKLKEEIERLSKSVTEVREDRSAVFVREVTLELVPHTRFCVIAVVAVDEEAA